MAVSSVIMQAKPAEMETKLWDKETDGPEIAAWCKGRLIDSKTMQIPDAVDGDSGFTAVFPCYVVKVDRRFLPMSIADVTAFYTKKIV